jgi:hypothetical protein
MPSFNGVKETGKKSSVMACFMLKNRSAIVKTLADMKGASTKMKALSK